MKFIRRNQRRRNASSSSISCAILDEKPTILLSKEISKMNRSYQLLMFTTIIGLSLHGFGVIVRGREWDSDIIDDEDDEYLIGVGSYDMTGPAADVNMMGYPTIGQVTSGIHFRLRARAFIVAQRDSGPRFVFVNLDSAMASQLVTIKLLEKLTLRYGSLYTEENVAISGIHTHAGPGGYSQYLTYSITCHGFVQQNFDAIVTAIENSIVQAHDNLKTGYILINKGDVKDGGTNRSPNVYMSNPEKERGHQGNVDKEMTLIKFVDSDTNTSIGAFNWYAIDASSMGMSNKLISGDNKGAASRLFEDWWFTNYSSTTTTTTSNIVSPTPQQVTDFQKKASMITSTGGEKCDEMASRSSKVRKNDTPLFVGAFCQSNAGDTTPNVLGTFCADTKVSCNFNFSSCNDNPHLCVGRGPGYPDESSSTMIMGDRQSRMAIELFISAKEKLNGKISHRHAYLNFTSLDVDLGQNKIVKTCPAALGHEFGAGNTDGPSYFMFGGLQHNRSGVLQPSKYQVDCQKPKKILLSTGEMFEPFAWAPAILPIQILRLGKLVILSVPAEFTTMAGRKLKKEVKESLVSNSDGGFDNETHVIIAGLANAYSQHVTTFEEYSLQTYEGASTLYGPNTLSAYIQEFKKLATLMAKRERATPTGLLPPDLSSKQVSLLESPTGDSLPPENKAFGDVETDVVIPKQGLFKRGDKISATFYSANPRNDILTEGTFALVEFFHGENWISVFDDDDLNLYFKWSRDGMNENGLATIEWQVTEKTIPGVYRLRHFGSFLRTSALNSKEYFTGASSAFTVS